MIVSALLLETVRHRLLSAGALFVLALGLAGCGAGQDVSAQSLRTARARWDAAKIRNYDLEWTSSGLSNTHYVVSVRDGRVMRIESLAPGGRRGVVKPAEPQFYGVDGLFTTMADELAQLDQPMPFGHSKGTKAVLRFTPDPKLGYPRNYRRDVMGAPTALVIDVLRLTPVAPRSGGLPPSSGGAEDGP